MSLQRIKTEIFQELDVLFSTAAVDELAGDAEKYAEKLAIIAKVAEALGIKTKLSTTTLDLVSGSVKQG